MSRNIKELLKLITQDHIKNAKKMTPGELVKVLKKLSDLYYNDSEQLVTDEQYDDIRDILEETDPENPYLEEIGAPIKGTKEKIKLPFKMGSLQKFKNDNIKEFKRWLTKYDGPYVISDKLDGASVQLY